MTEYIEREVLLDLYASPEDDPEIGRYFDMLSVPIPVIRQNILDMPAADVAPVVHGFWVGTADGYADGCPVYDMWECSNCGYDADGADEKPTWKYCPNCGAKMGGGGGDG